MLLAYTLDYFDCSPATDPAPQLITLIALRAPVPIVVLLQVLLASSIVPVALLFCYKAGLRTLFVPVTLVTSAALVALLQVRPTYSIAPSAAGSTCSLDCSGRSATLLQVLPTALLPLQVQPHGFAPVALLLPAQPPRWIILAASFRLLFCCSRRCCPQFNCDCWSNCFPSDVGRTRGLLSSGCQSPLHISLHSFQSQLTRVSGLA